MYKLLIVDDEPIIRKGIMKMVPFNDLNISEVFQAENGIDALELFNEHQVDLILADINMPKMDGIEFSRKVKSIKKHTKIALVTGYDYFDYAQQAIKAGVDDYVLKPISKKDVVEILKQLIAAIEDENIELELDVNQVEVTGYKKEILELFDTHYTNEAFSLQFIADEIGLSNGYLSTLFKDLFNQNFQDYLLKKRMEKAKILLLSTDLKNYEICDEIGFSDPNYFSTRFKHEFGLSPKQYKDKVKSK
jgi:two-component system response regulator YesN